MIQMFEEHNKQQCVNNNLQKVAVTTNLVSVVIERCA